MSESKESMDAREVQWFWDNRGWRPESDTELDKWLMDMRVKDELLCEKGCFPSGHFDEIHEEREAVDWINERRKALGLEPITEFQAMT
jgi:hypothetical protein